MTEEHSKRDKAIAVIASRLKCIDAISVEAESWIEKYKKLGYKLHLIAGKFGEPVDCPHFELPEMDYKHPEVRGVKRIIFGAKLDKEGKKAAEILLNNIKKRIKGPLKNYIIQNKIKILSIEDALISLKNLPLTLALSEIIEELGINTISRYHYIPWENPYFSKFENFPKIISAIPLNKKNIVQITNTESSMEKLFEKKKIMPRIIPNTIDIQKIQGIDEYNADFRKALGIRDDQLIFLQPTRVKRNKFVERSIKLVSEINDIMKKDNVLVITGSPVYSSGNYFEEIVKKINKQAVSVIFANDKIFLQRHQNTQQKFYSIHDAYAHADIILYPNSGDAFGNPVIEACAYKKPIVVNDYPNLKEFIDKGFKFVVMKNKVDNEIVSDTYGLIINPDKTKEMIENNFSLLTKHYSSENLDSELLPILAEFDKEHPGLISKVAGLIPSSIWRKKEAPEKEQKSEKLKNKKGGYKEPK